MGNLLINFEVKDVSSEFTYSDIQLPVSKNPATSNLNINTDLKAIKGSLSNIFNFKIGERILLPEFGNILYDHLYSKMTELTEKNIAISVRKMMQWEPRVSVTNVEITAYPEENQYDVKVFYDVPEFKASDQFEVTLNVVR